MRDRTAPSSSGPAVISSQPDRQRFSDPTAKTQSRPSAVPFTPKPKADDETRGRPSSKTELFWSNHFARLNGNPADLLETVILLQGEGKMKEVEAALRGYLKHHSRRAEPWMYEMLAVALDHNLAGEPSVLQALIYATILARRSDEYAENLITIANLMVTRGHLEASIPDGKGGELTVRVADLLDEAAEKLPGRPEPIIGSMTVAERTKDPERMARAAESLLALGWPGVDATWRFETRKRVEALAQTLLEEDRSADADMLLSRLAAAEPRDLFARLTWDGFADLDLVVEEPLGASARFHTPRTVFGGALVQNGRGKNPEEIYVCPLGFDGPYTFEVETVVNDEENPATEAKLEVITHEGTPDEQIQTFNIDLNDPQPIVVELSGGRRKEVLPFVVPKVLGMRISEPIGSEPSPTEQPR